MPTTYIGIDPGNVGAICAILHNLPKVPLLFDMPVKVITTGTKGNPTKKTQLDSDRLLNIFRSIKQESGDAECYAVLELPQLRPAVMPAPPLINGQPHRCSVCHQQHWIAGQGVASQGGFMRSGGIIHGLLKGVGIGFAEIAPRLWTADVFHGRSEKVDHRRLAAQMYPALAGKLERVKDDGRADAILIADYAMRKYEAPF